ncbi:ABC transporter substrate-binding protein [Chloroflexota bacterium]
MTKKNDLLRWGLRALLTLALLIPLLVVAACGATPAPTEAPPPEEPVEESAAVPTEEPAPEPTEEPAAEPVEEPAEATAENTLITAYFEDINTLDPDVWYDIEGGGTFRAVYEGLVSYGPGSNEIVPMLAESWEVSDDGLTYTFNLRDDVTFHDGTPFNADAVLYNFDRRLGVDQGPAYMLADIEEAEAVDDYTLKLTLSQPVGPFLHLLANMWGPKMISPAAIQENEVDGDWAQEWAIDNMVGTGPYKLDELVRGEKMVLAKNEDYWGGWEGDHVDQVHIRIIPETATQRLLLENGDLDILMHGIAFSDLDAFIENPDLTVQELPSNFVHILHQNAMRDQLTDPKVRQAVSYAWDYDGVRQAVGATHIDPLITTYPQGFLGGDEPPLPYTFDLEKAKELMAESEYPDGGFTLEFIYLPNEREYWRAAAQIFQANLAQLGIELDIQEMPISMIWDLYDDPQMTPHFFADSATPDGSDPYLWTSIVWHSDGWLNWSHYVNEEVDALIDEGLYTVDEDERADIYREVGRIVGDDAPAIFVGDGLDHFAYQNNIGGIVQYPGYPWTIDFYHVNK